MKTKNTGTVVRRPKVKTSSAEFPKYLMKISGERVFLGFRDAYVAYDNGLLGVQFGRYVLNADYTVRKMTGEDKSRISNAADEYSGSK